jgi:hypothetical protein
MRLSRFIPTFVAEMLSNKKKAMHKSVQFLGVSLLFTACTYNNIITEVRPESNYLPLEIGNSWDFKTLYGSPYTRIHREVMGKATVNNREYYLLVTTSSYSTIPDSAYYRIDNNGFVYIHRYFQGNFEDNRFRLNANNGDSWTFPVDSNSIATIKTTAESLILGNTEIKDCKSYFFNVLNWADEEYTITLAPGIGFAKEYSNAWGFGQILKSAKIHGEIHNF